MNRMAAARYILLPLFVAPAAAGALAPKVEVRVRLERQLPSVEVSGYGLQVTKPSPFITVSAPKELMPRMAAARITRRKDGDWSVKWKGSREPAQRIQAERLSVRGQMVRVGLRPVPYDFEVSRNLKSGLDVIARLDLDTYLAGVLPAEMPLSWPLEALKAQVVAARSFVLRMAFERREKAFDVDSTIHDQVYEFLGETLKHPEWKLKLNQAIGDTRGETLLDGKSHVLKAFYSADCGCQSEDPKFVWGPVESFESVKDPLCAARRPNLWKVNLDRREVRARLLAEFALPPNASLKALHVGSRSPSGRVAQMVADFSVDGQTRKFTLLAQEFRRLIGFQRVRSAAFAMRWLGDRLEISGEGIGHGVGLCQLGARGLAASGMGYRDILKLYYPRASLKSPQRI